MPSAGEQNFLARDVDVLVHGIKQSLKLSNFKEKSNHNRIIRSSPYYDRNSRTSRKLARKIYTTDVNPSKKSPNYLDPYLELKLLIQQGRLISEAVRKLQTMNLVELSNEVKDDDHEEDDDDV